MAERQPADPSAATVRTLTFQAAVYEAVEQAMRGDPDTFLMGVGADDPSNVRGGTGMVEQFGSSRVVGTPLSEDAMTGVAIGAALAGMRPLQVHGRMDFALLAMNQLVNVAAKARYMYGGAASVPVTVRATIGRSWGQGAQHSQGLQSLFAHIPGLRVVMPSTPHHAKGTMLWALQRSKDPVVYIDHRMLHKTVGSCPETLDPDQFGPDIGWRGVVTDYVAEITIVANSYMVLEAKRAVDHIAKLGVSATLFDPVWLRPFPALPAIAADALRTRMLLVVDCGWPSYGFGAEVLAGVSEALAPVHSNCQKAQPLLPPIQMARMGYAETVCPTSKPLEDLYYPNAKTIAQKAYEMVTGHAMPHWEEHDAPEVSGFRGPF